MPLLHQIRHLKDIVVGYGCDLNHIAHFNFKRFLIVEYQVLLFSMSRGNLNLQTMKNMKMNLKNIQRTWQLLLLAILLVVSGCGSKDKVGSEQMISGSGSKTWSASKEVNAAGDKEKLLKEEKQETMQFYNDGRFALGGGGTLETGTWSFDQAAKRLTLRFQGQDVTENFEVTQLTEKDMHLKANDGSVMELKAQ